MAWRWSAKLRLPMLAVLLLRATRQSSKDEVLPMRHFLIKSKRGVTPIGPVAVPTWAGGGVSTTIDAATGIARRINGRTGLIADWVITLLPVACILAGRRLPLAMARYGSSVSPPTSRC